MVWRFAGIVARIFETPTWRFIPSPCNFTLVLSLCVSERVSQLAGLHSGESEAVVLAFVGAIDAMFSPASQLAVLMSSRFW